MKSDRKAKQGKDAERPKLGKSALQIPDADRYNGTVLRKANRRVSQQGHASAGCRLEDSHKILLGLPEFLRTPETRGQQSLSK